MKIETKFNIDDQVYFIYKTKIIKSSIHDMSIQVNNDGDIKTICYIDINKKDRDYINAAYLFLSIDDLLDSLRKDFEK